MNQHFSEHPVLVYPTTASALGFEEAGLLSILTAQAIGIDGEVELSSTKVQALVPWWSDVDITRLLQKLKSANALTLSSGPYKQSKTIRYRITTATNKQQTAPAQRRELGKTLIEPNWRPDLTTMARLEQMSVDKEFIEDLVAEFVMYWRDRGETQHSWDSKFYKHAIRQWNIKLANPKANTAKQITTCWHPDPNAMLAITNQGIPREFANSLIDEFIIYWQDSQQSKISWNSAFITHVKTQWQRRGQTDQSTRSLSLHDQLTDRSWALTSAK